MPDSIISSSVNIFFVDECKTIASKSEKMSFVATKWQSLGDDERSVWQNEAQRIERAVPSSLSLAEKRKQIAKGKKNLIKEVKYAATQNTTCTCTYPV